MNPRLLLAIIALITAIVTNADRLTILWDRVFGAQLPAKTENWTHRMTTNPAELENLLNRLSPSPDNLAIYTSGPNLHYWYRGGDTGTQYHYQTLPWRGEDHPDANFFHRDGKIIPAGFVPGGTFAYLEITKPPSK